MARLGGYDKMLDRAELWEAMVSIRLRDGDLAGAHRAMDMAKECRQLVGWTPGSHGRIGA